MQFFDKLEKTMLDTGQSISRKAKELAEVTRLKNMLHTCEEVTEQNYRESGRSKPFPMRREGQKHCESR